MCEIPDKNRIMKKTWIYLLLMLVIALPACKKILDIERATDTNPTPVTVEDFEQILNNPGICEAKNYEILEYPTDNKSEGFVPMKEMSPFYTWGVDPWNNGSPFTRIFSEDLIYSRSYKWIGQMNLVIEGMPTALPSGQMNDRRALAIAQAKINRAYFYLLLVNTYGAAYQLPSSSTDLGVPLVLKVNNQVSYPRARVEKVYQQILADLQEALAISELPNLGRNVIHPGRAAALAVLARTYLYMGNYAQAEKAASDALAIKSDLQNYLNFGAPSAFDGRPLTLYEQGSNPEVLLTRVNYTAIDAVLPPVFVASDELLRSFDQNNDKRFITSFSPFNTDSSLLAYRFGVRNTDLYINYSIGVPEMMLIKAECLARANDAAGAVNLLNTLCATRILNYSNLSTNVSADQALNFVLDERRRELMFKGIRLFDLKRLNLDPRFKKDIVRRDANGQTLVTLPAGSPNYLIPFSRTTLNANSLLVQNPRVQLN